MKKKIINYVFGVLLITFAVTSLFSDNPNIDTSTGKLMIIVAGGFGTIMILRTLKQK